METPARPLARLLLAVALSADIRIAADDTVYAIPAARLGLGYGYTGVNWLVHLVGPAYAKEIFFTVRKFDGEEALRRGLINRNPDPSQLGINDYVDRSRRMHRNDLENIPAFLVVGLLFVAVVPPLWAAQVLMYGFVAARAAHFVAYATSRSHEVRATFYTIGSLIVIYMAAHVLWVVLRA